MNLMEECVVFNRCVNMLPLQQAVSVQGVRAAFATGALSFQSGVCFRLRAHLCTAPRPENKDIPASRSPPAPGRERKRGLSSHLGRWPVVCGLG